MASVNTQKIIDQFKKLLRKRLIKSDSTAAFQVDNTLTLLLIPAGIFQMWAARASQTYWQRYAP